MVASGNRVDGRAEGARGTGQPRLEIVPHDAVDRALDLEHGGGLVAQIPHPVEGGLATVEGYLGLVVNRQHLDDAGAVDVRALHQEVVLGVRDGNCPSRAGDRVVGEHAASGHQDEGLLGRVTVDGEDRVFLGGVQSSELSDHLSGRAFLKATREDVAKRIVLDFVLVGFADWTRLLANAPEQRRDLAFDQLSHGYSLIQSVSP